MPDDRLHQYIRDLEQRAEPDPDFEERLFAELGGTPRRRPMRWPVLLAAASIAVITVAGGAIAGGWVGQLASHRSPQPNASAVAVVVETPSESASETASPSASETPTSTPTPSPSPSSAPSQAPSPTLNVGGSWAQLASTPTVPTGIADFIVGKDGRLYAIPWGDDADRVLVYDPGANTWQLRQPTTKPPYDVGTGEPFVAASNGLLYSFAGGPEGTEVFTYDPRTNRWSTSPIAHLAIDYSDAVLGKDGKIYLMGVCCTSGAQLVTFDPATNQTTEVGQRNWNVISLVRDDTGLMRMTGQTGVGTYDPVSKAWTWQDLTPSAPLRGTLTAAGAQGVYDAANGLVAWRSGRSWVSMEPPPNGQRIAAMVWLNGTLFTLTVDRSLTGNQDGTLQLWAISPTS